jgi:hypothetical protein
LKLKMSTICTKVEWRVISDIDQTAAEGLSELTIDSTVRFSRRNQWTWLRTMSFEDALYLHQKEMTLLKRSTSFSIVYIIVENAHGDSVYRNWTKL